jgi:asparagine synthase (glutamine-hydrolysing)
VCGIAGFIAPDDEASIARMISALGHRGPDGQGSAPLRCGGQTAGWFGHKRLAILDLSKAGHQPMSTDDGRFTITYNGEVFNFREVREKLERAGEHFISRSDTEVILKAFRAWGEKCLHELRGMFAIAIWDAKLGRLFLARDRLGIKPLYYHAANGHFFFASELRALLACGQLPRHLNAEGILDYLRFGSVSDPDTMIEGAMALLPGHYLIWEKGSLQDVEYWEIPCFSQASPSTGKAEKPGEDTVAELRSVLWEAARQRLVSDVPIGVFLSGGVDSSALVGMLSSESADPVNTFSLVFRECDFDEAVYSRAVASHFGTHHHELVLSQHDALVAIPDAIRAMDQPSVDGINTYIISQEARRAGIRVALTGLGGDEIFGGYSSFKTVPSMERFVQSWSRVPKSVRGCLSASLSHLLPDGERNHKIKALLQENGHAVHPYALSRMLFVPDRIKRLSRVSGETVSGGRALARTLAAASNFDPINRVSYLELRNYMANTLLRDADCMSMAHGLELRVPFIDHKLVEFLFTIPGAFKIGGQIAKPLLVQVTAGLLPEMIVRRRKRGFTLPFQHWLRDELRPEVETTFRKEKSPLADFVDLAGMREVWREFLGGHTSWTRPWALFVLHRWCEVNL